jgi:hypothetical protein
MTLDHAVAHLTDPAERYAHAAAIRTEMARRLRREAAAAAASASAAPAEKFCPRCAATKPSSAFGANAARADGLQSMCKACRVESFR